MRADANADAAAGHGMGEFNAPHFLLQTEPKACAIAVENFMNQSEPDPPLDLEQSMRVSKLTQEELLEMDRVLLAQAAPAFRKVARIVGMAVGELATRLPGVPDIYYAQRVRNLVELGKLESQGDLRRMRSSEVRLPRA